MDTDRYADTSAEHERVARTAARDGREPSGPDERPVYTMAATVELTGLHPQTLRAYDRGGLVTPGRSEGGNRLYSRSDVARLRRVHELSAAGINHAGIARILALEAEVGRLEGQLRRALRRIYAAGAALAADRRGTAAPVALRRSTAVEKWCPPDSS